MRYVYLVTFFVIVLTVGVLGFRGSISVRPPLEVFADMDRQAKYKPQGASAFFADRRSERPIPVGVVARGNLRLNTHLYEGRTPSGEWAAGFPAEVEISHAFLDRGRERYNIYCGVCHGDTGNGRGIVTNYGWGGPVSLHSDLYRNMTEGEIFNTITHGKNTMYSYADKIKPKDRWAVIAYLRALQRAQNGRVDDVGAAFKAGLEIQ
jgi:mono/diheme cytochrome c family protein